MAVPDIYTQGIASGWKVVDAATLTAPLAIEADVAIVGSVGVDTPFVMLPW